MTVRFEEGNVVFVIDQDVADIIIFPDQAVETGKDIVTQLGDLLLL